ncbi:AAC(3) family N-acetyltransferase [candidate division KSB1 bacterium]|nr:AAC(3) family N-acetyltransferase [candidate division KSB1 bacterium]
MSRRAIQKFVDEIGIRPGQQILLHASFRALAKTFPGVTPSAVIEAFQKRLGCRGSLIMPTFAYCFKKREPGYPVFDRAKSPSAVGALSEAFRLSPDVIRTSSPTHSFSLWGHVKQEIPPENAPASPLGAGSVLQWLAEQSDSAVVMLGVGFRALTFGHYLETIAPVPWVDVNPWEHAGVLPIGVSIDGEQKLIQIPGCSGGFVHLQQELEKTGHSFVVREPMRTLYLSVSLLLQSALERIRRDPLILLCPAGYCRACDTRREWYILNLHHRLTETPPANEPRKSNTSGF